MSANRTLLDFLPDKGDWDGDYMLVECRRALSPSSAGPSVQYALNPYGGCEHGCVYCYAPGVTHSDLSSWRVVRVKTNIAQRLTRELPAVSGSTIAVGTVTDPYQYAERRFLLTRSCLEVIKPERNHVVILTKSDLVTRDIDVFQRLCPQVLVTVTGLDDRVSKILEPGAPMPKARLKAVEELFSEGVDVAVNVSPVTSFLEGREEELVEAIAATGVKKVVMDNLDLRHLDVVAMERRRLFPSKKSMDVMKDRCERRGMVCGPVFSA